MTSFQFQFFIQEQNGILALPQIIYFFMKKENMTTGLSDRIKDPVKPIYSNVHDKVALPIKYIHF